METLLQPTCLTVRLANNFNLQAHTGAFFEMPFKRNLAIWREYADLQTFLGTGSGPSRSCLFPLVRCIDIVSNFLTVFAGVDAILTTPPAGSPAYGHRPPRPDPPLRREAAPRADRHATSPGPKCAAQTTWQCSLGTKADPSALALPAAVSQARPRAELRGDSKPP